MTITVTSRSITSARPSKVSVEGCWADEIREVNHFNSFKVAVIRDLGNWKGGMRWVVLCLAVHAKNRKASGTHIKLHIVSSTSLVLHGCRIQPSQYIFTGLQECNFELRDNSSIIDE